MAVDATSKAARRRLATCRALLAAFAIFSCMLLIACSAAAARALLLGLDAEAEAEEAGSEAATLRRCALQAARKAPAPAPASHTGVGGGGDANHHRPYVVMTATTAAYLPFVANMRCSLEKATGDARILVAALDAEAYAGARALGLKPVAIGALSSPSHKVAAFGTTSFKAITRRKLDVVRAVLALGIDVMFVDGDVHFCDAFPEPFALASTADAAATAAADIVAQRTDVTAEVINSGVYFARASARTVALFDRLRSFDAANDQVAFNRLMCRAEYGGSADSTRRPTRCTWKERNVTATFLPERRYPLGCTAVDGVKLHSMPPTEVAAMCATRKVALVHFSCWGSWNKRAQMKRRGMWSWDETLRSCVSSSSSS